MALTKEDIINAVADMSVMEVAELIEAMEEKFGVSAAAAVVAVTEAELIAHSKASLAHYKVPKRVIFATELPRNASGKILKRELRVLYGGGESAVSAGVA